MQNFKKIRTDYKHSMLKKHRTFKETLLLKGKWPFALGLLTFALVWRVGLWWHTPQQPETEILHPLSDTFVIPPPKDAAETVLKLETDASSRVITEIQEPSHEGTAEAPSISIPAESIEPPLSTLPEATLKATLETPKRHIQNYTIKPGTSLAYYLQKERIAPLELQTILDSIKHSEKLKKIFPGQQISVEKDAQGQLHSLTLKISPTQELKILKHAEKNYESILINKPIERKITFKNGIIEDSLFLTGKQAHLPEKLIMELAQIFEYDIDFALDIKPHDHFKVLYEDNYVDGKKIGHGPILTAEFAANGKVYQAVRYTDKLGKSAYFSPNGESLKKAFIRTPVQFTRISSHFNLQRKHPILHKIRAHKGVDYAAPYGTPVKASGSGKVIFVGRRGGYGNAIILQHGQKYSTLYAHLSKFASGLREGKKVEQGQVIGYVGSTGLASGPHLHYEFRINGVHKNPLTVPLPNGKPIPKNEMADFKQHTQNYLALLKETEETLMAKNE